MPMSLGPFAVTCTCTNANCPSNLYPGDDRTSLTSTIAHELVESIVNPDNPEAPGWGEISDPCETWPSYPSYLYNGYWVAQYWSNYYNSCVEITNVREGEEAKVKKVGPRRTRGGTLSSGRSARPHTPT